MDTRYGILRFGPAVNQRLHLNLRPLSQKGSFVDASEKRVELIGIQATTCPVNSVIRKFTRNRKIYPTKESALKLVYMAISEASKRWTLPIRNCKSALNHFAIMFEDRMPELTGK